MKKFLVSVLALSMILSLCACGETPAATTAAPAATTAAPAATTEAPATTAATEESMLVGVSMPTKDLQRWNQDGENMQKELEAAANEPDEDDEDDEE